MVLHEMELAYHWRVALSHQQKLQLMFMTPSIDALWTARRRPTSRRIQRSRQSQAKPEDYQSPSGAREAFSVLETMPKLEFTNDRIRRSARTPRHVISLHMLDTGTVSTLQSNSESTPAATFVDRSADGGCHSPFAPFEWMTLDLP